MPSPRTLHVADGTLTYDDHGSGPLVIALPGLGDLRRSYRFLAPLLAAAGYRVVSVDLRGHGGSSARWPSYEAAAVGQDVLDLIDHVGGGPATIIGNSFSAAAAVWAATERPSSVAGTVLVGPFVRVPKPNPGLTIAMNTLFRGPWSVRAWAGYHGTLFPTARPADYVAYRAMLRANLAEPGRFDAVRAMMFRRPDDTERRLARLATPSLVLMGSKDPDFPDPAAEARWIAHHVGGDNQPEGGRLGEVAILEGAGHYPQAEMPAETAARLLPFLAKVHRAA
jgi:pimeloyl-ACP methyl ester carboxylesterase